MSHRLRTTCTSLWRCGSMRSKESVCAFLDNETIWLKDHKRQEASLDLEPIGWYPDLHLGIELGT